MIETTLLLVFAGLGAAALVVLMLERLSWLRRHTRRRVLVQTSDGSSIEGVLAGVGADGLVLTSARIVSEAAPGTHLIGETFVPHSRLRLLQTLPPPDAP